MNVCRLQARGGGFADVDVLACRATVDTFCAVLRGVAALPDAATEQTE